jgi:hypothetical protein
MRRNKLLSDLCRPIFPLTTLSRRIEHSFNVTVQCPHHAYPKQGTWVRHISAVALVNPGPA